MFVTRRSFIEYTTVVVFQNERCTAAFCFAAKPPPRVVLANEDVPVDKGQFLSPLRHHERYSTILLCVRRVVCRG